ncbi:MAG: histidine phosphatase family protein [Clostridia bacterium]|nr:histidine phosphatase family protein [Clostridia bacterium]
MTKVYFVRHAKPETEGEDRLRPLTAEGLSDSALVLDTLKDKKIDAVYCSPYTRSIQTVESIAKHLGKKIEIDERLHERVSGGVFNNRDELLKRWEDFEYHEREGESLGSVQRRNISALNDILARHDGDCIVIGTHGTALSMIFNYFDPSFGIDDFFRIVKWMPYIVECDFENGILVSKTELAYIDKS